LVKIFISYQFPGVFMLLPVITEDCLKDVDNRFQLVLVAAKRARDLTRGATPLVQRPVTEKSTVTALREVAAGKISKEYLNT
jgi:DNA-directed RNA polymerase subunit omega